MGVAPPPATIGDDSDSGGDRMAGGRVMRGATIAILGWLTLAARPAPAANAPRLIGESARTLQRLAEAAALEQQQRWADTVELYLRLLDEAGDDLVPSDADPRHYLPVRGLVHHRLAARRELLQPYRDRVEPRAKRLLEQGEAQRAPQPLERLVDAFFCSRSAEAALHLLGDLACERGDFERARYYWHLLEPPATPRGLAYPDPQGDVALARAKQILARILAGETVAAAAEFRAFRTAHPQAAGHLAGRDGNLAATLQHLLDAPDLARVPAPVGLARAPTSFAGDGTRNGVLAGMLPPFSPQPRYPAVPLPDADPRTDGLRVIQRPLIRASALAFHPVIACGQVFVTDARRVTAYDLSNGHLSGQLDLALTEPRLAALGTRLPSTIDARYTLTVAGDRVFVRLGQPKMRPERGEPGSFLACLQWRPEGATPADRLTARWLLPVKSDAGEPEALFEGTPAVRDGRLYVAVTRLDGNRAITAIACYDADDPAAGALWKQEVYEAGAETADRTRQHLVTLAGPHVVYCSHAGVIVALEASTGRRAWALRYPARGRGPRAGRAAPRDLTPCVAAGGRLYAAPADADRVYCLDAATGAPVWASDPLEVAHLLGVVRGRLVCTMGGYTAGLCALDTATGQPVPDWGYRVPGADTLAPFGRGLLCQDRVYWPTRGAGVKELLWDGTVGYAPTAFQQLPGGNLAYGDGCLVVATADRLHILIGASQEAAQSGLRLGQRPRTAEEHYRHAIHEAAAGRPAAALQHFRAAERLSPDAELRGQVRNRRHDLLLWQAEGLRQAGRPAAEVRAAFQRAAQPEYPPARRLLALTRRAEYEEASGRPEEAARVWQSVLAAADLRRVTVRDAAGRWHCAEACAARRIGELQGNGTAAAESDDGANAAQAPQASSETPTSVTPPPELREPIELAWRIPYDARREWPLLPENGPAAGPRSEDVYVAAHGQLTCRSAPNGKVRWHRTLPLTPVWLAALDGAVIVASADGVARLSAADGRIQWQWSVPEAAPWFTAAGWRDPEPAPLPAATLGGFRLAGGRLFAWMGTQSLVAIDAATGQPLWQRQAPNAGLRPEPATGFHPHFYADAACAVVQTADGQRWVLDATTGRLLHAGPAPADPWTGPPLALDTRRLLIVEDQRLVALDRATWEPDWTFDLPRWPSLSGELPQARLDGGVLLVGVGRNECYEVERLDPATGRRLDPEPVVVGRERSDLTATALDGDTLTVADRDELRMIDCRTGQVVQRTGLEPAPAWRVERTSGGLVLWTVPRVSATEPPPRAGQVVVLPGSHEGLMGSRLKFERFGPRGQVVLVRNGVVVVTGEDVRSYRGAGAAKGAK